MDDSVRSQFGYEEILRAMRDQADALGALRGGAGTLFAAIALATSFFGGAALTSENGHLGDATWIAIGAFFAAGALVLAVLFLGDLTFSADEAELRQIMNGSLTMPGIAEQLLRRYASNKQRLKALRVVFLLSAVALFVEVAFWIIGLVE
jgi:hypothetical protein